MFYVRIINPGWETFDGDFAGYPFKSGISVNPLPRSICDRLSSLVHVELSDADGKDLGQGGAAARHANRRNLHSDVVAPLARMSESEKSAEIKQDMDNAGVTRTIYSKSQLEQIASLEGIRGLRKVAEPWNVKDRSIPKLIMLIIKAQNAYTKLQTDKLDEQRRARAAAGDAAMAEQIRIEAEIMKKARILTEDETPNAIGANGEPVHVPATPPKNEFEPAPETGQSELA